MKVKRGDIRIILGLLLIAAALSLMGYNRWESDQAGKQSADALAALQAEAPALDAALQDLDQPYGRAGSRSDGTPLEIIPEGREAEEIEIPDYILNPEMDMPKQEVQGYSYIAVLSIPALELELPIMDHWDYDRLRVAPCRYTGSAYTDNLVIAGHAYETHFWPLHWLSLGSDVYLTDMDGNVFHYQVQEIYTLGDSDTWEMVSSGYALTLFTCTRNGEARLTVRCDRVD